MLRDTFTHALDNTFYLHAKLFYVHLKLVRFEHFLVLIIVNSAYFNLKINLKFMVQYNFRTRHKDLNPYIRKSIINLIIIKF
jgi:hypothetical protein